MGSSVKDKDNLVSYNVWSCGEYSNNLIGFVANNLEDTISSEWSTKGHDSIKCISNMAVSSILTQFDYVEENKTLTASFNCLSKESSLKFKLYQKNNSTWSSVTLDIPASNNNQTPQLTLTTSGSRAAISP